MRDIRIAEWILSLVTAPERAAATAGDWAEQSVTRGRVWLWCSLSRTVALLVWRAIAEMPAGLIGLIFLGAAIEVAVEFLFAALSGLIFIFVSWLHLTAAPWSIVLSAQPLITSLIIGRILARRAVGRELAAGLVYFVLAPIVNIISDPPEGLSMLAVVVLLLADAATQAPALAGAVWGRRRRLRALRA